MWVQGAVSAKARQPENEATCPEVPSRAGCRDAVETRATALGTLPRRSVLQPEHFLVEASPGQGFFKNNSKCHFLQGAASDCYS